MTLDPTTPVASTGPTASSGAYAPAGPPALTGPPASTGPVASLHPDCPDWRRLGPTGGDAALRAHAAGVETDVQDREEGWSRGFNRRRLLKGGLGVGVLTLGSQLVSTRVSYAAGYEPTSPLVVVFLRGGADGLSLLVPVEDPNLLAKRPGIAVRGSALIPLDRGFALHPGFASLRPLVNAGKVAAIPAVSTPDLSRSHFQAMDCLERGGAEGSPSQPGWLDRVLAQAGTGTTFRSVAVGSTMPRALSGAQPSLAMRGLKYLSLVGAEQLAPPSQRALTTLYTGLDHPLATQSLLALGASAQAKALSATETAQGTRGYPAGDFAAALRTVATLIREDAGVRVACVEVGGWDTHTGMGTAASGDMTNNVVALSDALAAFAADLGSHLDRTTVVTMTEFGRRVEQNASGGTDHGHGAVALALGGGVQGGVKGRWSGLADGVLDQGDVPGLNDYRDVLSELVMKRVGLSPGQLQSVFPGWRPTSLGVMA